MSEIESIKCILNTISSTISARSLKKIIIKLFKFILKNLNKLVINILMGGTQYYSNVSSSQIDLEIKNNSNQNHKSYSQDKVSDF